MIETYDDIPIEYLDLPPSKKQEQYKKEIRREPERREQEKMPEHYQQPSSLLQRVDMYSRVLLRMGIFIILIIALLWFGTNFSTFAHKEFGNSIPVNVNNPPIENNYTIKTENFNEPVINNYVNVTLYVVNQTK